MVKEHVLSILGPASMAYGNTLVKMSKLQAAQVGTQHMKRYVQKHGS